MKKVYLISQVVLLPIFGLFSNAQSPKVDSLKKALIECKESNRYDVLWGLAYELYDVDNPQALIYAKEANKYALKKGDTLNIVMSGRILGQLLRRADKLDESIKLLTGILPISQRHDFNHEVKLILNALAVSYSQKTEHDKALEFHFQSLALREKEGDQKEISITLNNIGFIYFKLGNSNLALDYFLKSLKAKEEVNDTFDLDRLMINIGLCYSNLADYQNAEKYLNKGFSICAPSCSNQIIMEGEIGLAESFFKQKNYKAAEQHHKKSLYFSVKENAQRFQLENLLELAEIDLLSNDLKMARVYLRKAESLPDKKQYPQILIYDYQLNADLYTRIGDFQKANLFRKRYSELKDSTYDAEMFKNVLKVQTQFTERENLANIASQTKIIALQKEAIFRQRLLNLAIGSVALLIIGLSVVLFKINRQKQKINKILDQRVKERTSELEQNRDELKHAHDEQAMVLKKVTSDLTSSLATIKGLSNTATKDLPQEQAIYFKEAEATTERLVNYVNKYSVPESL